MLTRVTGLGQAQVSFNLPIVLLKALPPVSQNYSFCPLQIFGLIQDNTKNYHHLNCLSIHSFTDNIYISPFSPGTEGGTCSFELGWERWQTQSHRVSLKMAEDGLQPILLQPTVQPHNCLTSCSRMTHELLFKVMYWRRSLLLTSLVNHPQHLLPESG